MNLDRNWVPMKWPCGPLEIARRNKAGTVSADLRETLQEWARPSALELLKSTPVNCLIVEWAGGGPEDSAQQQALRPLLEAGRGMGISFVAKIAPEGDAGVCAAAARAAGLSAAMIENAPGLSCELPVIRQFSRDKAAWETASTIFSATENVWPGLNLQTLNGDTALAGPTGVPWVNSNAWVSLLAGELATGKTLRLDFDPPAASNALHPAAYALAVADSCAYGSQWIISLDDKLRASLPNGKSQAQDAWKKLCEAVAFFQSHKEWQGFRSQGILAIISDFRGDNAYMSGEVLNLLNRRQVQFRIIERAEPLRVLGGLKAVLWLDPAKPSLEQRARLLAFVRQGGLLIAADSWGAPGAVPTKNDPSLRYRLYTVGKGQIAVAEEVFQDPYQVAADTHLLVSRRNDLVRLYNPETTNCHSSGEPVSPDNGKRLVQVLNYSSAPANYVTLWVNDRVESARFWQFEAAEAGRLEGRPASPGTEFDLPPLWVYCALEFEGKSL